MERPLYVTKRERAFGLVSGSRPGSLGRLPGQNTILGDEPKPGHRRKPALAIGPAIGSGSGRHPSAPRPHQLGNPCSNVVRLVVLFLIAINTQARHLRHVQTRGQGVIAVQK
jgi:hypothetical protein